MRRFLLLTLLVVFGFSPAFADNDYFESSTYHMTAGSRARASDVNTFLDAIETGLDKLPSETNLKRGLINYAADAGAANAYVVTLTYAPTEYTDGMEVIFKASAANTGASTINVNALGVKSIVRPDNAALAAGDIEENEIVHLRYNSSLAKFVVQVGARASVSTGTMATQNADAVAITGGTLTSVTITNPKLNEDVTLTAKATKLNNLSTSLVLISDYANNLSTAATAIGTSTVTTVLVDSAIAVAATLDLSAYTNIYWEFIGTGQFAPAAGQTLTLPSPGHIIASPTQQIFSGAGAVSFPEEGPVYWNWWGTTTSAFNSAYASSRIVRLVSGSSYALTTAPAAIDKHGSFIGTVEGAKQGGVVGGAGYAQLTYTMTTGNVFEITSRNNTIQGFSVYGPGTGGSEYVFNVSGGESVIQNLDIRNVSYGFYESSYGNTLRNITVVGCNTGAYLYDGASISMYDVFFSPAATGGAETGIKIYRKRRLTFHNVQIDDADYGIYVTTTPGAQPYVSSANLFSCHFEDIAITDIYNASVYEGTYPYSYASNWNLFGGRFGKTLDPRDVDMFHLGPNDRLLMSGGAYIVAPTSWGTGYYINDARSSGLNAKVILQNVRFGEANNTSTPAYTHLLSDGYAKVIWEEEKSISSSVTNRETSGADATDLGTSTITQNAQTVWAGIEAFVFGSKTGGAGNKTLTFYWGTNSFAFSPAANDENAWKVEIRIYFVTTTQAKVVYTAWNGSTPTTLYQATTVNADLSAGNVTFKVSAQCADAADKVILRCFDVKYIRY